MKKPILDRIKMLFESVSEETSSEESFKDVKTDDERILRLDGDAPAVDVTVQEVTPDGVIDLEDGTYVLAEEEGVTMTIEVVGGVITAVTEDEADAETPEEDATETPEDAALSTVFKAVAKFSYDTEKFAVIKQISKWDITVDQDDFAIGTLVSVSYEENGEMITYALTSGTYELEDGRQITLNDDGSVILIVDAAGVVIEAPAVGDATDGDAPAAEPAATDAPAEEVMSAVADALEKLKAEHVALTAEFEAFKKAPSAKHTSPKMDFSDESPKTNTKRTPLDIARGK